MTKFKFIYENGIEVIKDGGVSILNQFGTNPVVTSEIQKNIDKKKLVARIQISRNQYGDERLFDELIFRPSGKPFSLESQILMGDAQVKSGAFSKFQTQYYILGNVAYHNIRLAKLYGKISNEFSCISESPGFPYPTSTNFGAQFEAYYEFDALITSLRRGFDYLRYFFPDIYNYCGSLSLSFRKEIKREYIPKEDSEYYKSIWSKHGEELTNYRNCIQHYSPIDFGFGNARLTKSEGIWETRFLIPDNPLAQSKIKFQYEKGIDALTFCTGCSEGLLETTKFVVRKFLDKNDC